jgi:hypothetical protein
LTEGNDEFNEVNLEDPLDNTNVLNIEAQVISIFRDNYSVSKSTFHKHFGLFLFDEGVGFEDILTFKLDKMMKARPIRELVLKRMTLHSNAPEAYQGKLFL